jgi:hypothetical protein
MSEPRGPGRMSLRRVAPWGAAVAALLAAALFQVVVPHPASAPLTQTSISVGSAAGGSHLPWARAFTACMQSRGVQLPDPTGDLVLTFASLNLQSAQYRDAARTCEALVRTGPAMASHAALVARLRSAALRFSVCMRAHGIAVFPDPRFIVGIAVLNLPPADLPAAKSPRFRAAHAACRSALLPSGTG